MGNRAVIVWQDRDGRYSEESTGVYVHWNGGRDSVEAFLAYCEMQGYADPADDPESIQKFANVVDWFFGGEGRSFEVGQIANLDTDNYDNGMYVCKGWRIVGREYFRGEEQRAYDFPDMMHSINASQPEGVSKPDAEVDAFIAEYIQKYGKPIRTNKDASESEDASKEDEGVFEIGQQVLVRDFSGAEWIAAHFAGIDINAKENGARYIVFGGRRWRECLPLEGNEALIGRMGSSAEHPDREDPEIAEYEYLQPVEVLNLGKWEHGHYIDVDKSPDSLGLPHCVVLDGSRGVDWYSDEDVRPVQG